MYGSLLSLFTLALSLVVPLAASAADVQAATDPVLEALVGDALENSPEYARARVEAEAERERVPQAGALPDPTFTLGIQNEGIDRIEIGTRPMSYWLFLVTQPLGFPGKRGLRAEVARAKVTAVEARRDRIRLSTVASVERAYVDLLLVRGQLDLLRRYETLWQETESATRSRYAVGEAPQVDLLRSQLERTRLQRQRIQLEVAERTRIQVLNRLRVHPLDEPIETRIQLDDAEAPALAGLDDTMDDAERRSPDLVVSRKTVNAAEASVKSAERERWPDFTMTAGIMPRGSTLPAQYTAIVGMTVPIFWESKQARVLAESERRRDAEQLGENSTLQVVRLRARERHETMEGLLRTLQLYRETLLTQSEAAVESTVSQYRVGKISFAAVLDVMRGTLADQGGYLTTMADAQRVAIATREVSLEPPAGLGGGLFDGASSAPGASGGDGAGDGRRTNGAAAGAGAPAASPGGNGGGGMPAGM